MVVTDACNRGDVRVANVGRVELSAEPDFEDRDVDFGAGEQNERDDERPFEERQRARVAAFLFKTSVKAGEFEERFREKRFAATLSVDLETLGQLFDMRRRKKTDATSASAKERVERSANRSFAFGSGDMNDLEVLFRIPKERKKVF